MKTETVVARESQHTSLERARDFRCWLLEINGPLTNLTNEQFRLYEETFPKSKEIAWAFKDDSHQALVEALQAAEKELRGVPAVASVHAKVVAAIEKAGA